MNFTVNIWRSSTHSALLFKQCLSDECFLRIYISCLLKSALKISSTVRYSHNLSRPINAPSDNYEKGAKGVKKTDCL